MGPKNTKTLSCQVLPFGPRNLTKRFVPFYQRNIQYRARLKGPLLQFFRHCETFFRKFFNVSKVSPFNFCDTLQRNGANLVQRLGFSGTVKENT